MRPIKFRAWNGKEMIFYPQWATLHAQQVLVFEDGGHSYVDASDYDYPSRVELMQFTGLLDKNGKEIYEGDILTTRGLNEPLDLMKYGMEMVMNQNPRVVKYDNASFYPISGWIGEAHEDIGWEVIGNIHEDGEKYGLK